MRILFKETIWYEVDIDDDSPQKLMILNDFKSGEIGSAVEIFDKYGDATLDGSGDYMMDTGEQLDPEENNGFSTVEIYGDNHNIIWENGK